ncbi:MAG: hypothetical protein PHP01_07820, partial [Phycisphaerae bacterium]|nr:hypothetical protein [Phycisphaerae bacterium]
PVFIGADMLCDAVPDTNENSVPIADAGPEQIVYAMPINGCEVVVNGIGSIDPDGDELTYKWIWAVDGNDYEANGVSPTIELPPGEHTIGLIVNDGIVDSEADYVVITAIDNTPPELAVSITPDVLWPANHKMVMITPSITVSDNCDDSPEVTLVSITSSEDDNAKGDGNTTDDIKIIDGKIYLRAERSGTGDGRVYNITYQAVDASGNITTQSAEVTVPHDKGKSKK